MDRIEDDVRHLLEVIDQNIHAHPRHFIPDDLSSRAAGWVAKGSGSWTFLAVFNAATVIWLAGNGSGVFHFDPFPFGLYTMLVSVLAIDLASIILLFQNRQAQLEEAVAHNAYQQIAQTLALVKLVKAINEQQTAILTEVHAMRQSLDGPEKQ